MTANFNFLRLLKLIRKQWIENARIYFLSTLALIGILALVFIFWLVTGGRYYSEETLYIIYIFGLYIAGAIFASTSFSMLAEKRQGVYWLGFPASHLEKLLTVLFFNLVVFTIVYSLCFFGIKLVAVTYLQSLKAGDPTMYFYQLVDFRSNSGFMNVFPNFLYGFFAVQSFYLLGSIYFSRFSFIITTVVGIAFIFLFMWLSISLINNNLPSGFSWDGLYVSKFENRNGTDGGWSKYQLPVLLFGTLTFLAKFICAPVFWLITWFRLKETEI